MDISRITCAIWPWGTETREQMELAAKEITTIGYKTFESVKAAIYAYNMDLAAYREVLERFDLKPASFYFHFPSKGMEEQELFANLEKELEFVAKLGVSRVTLQATGGHPDRILTREELDYELKLMTRFANTAKAFSITTNLHPHDNTWVMYEEEIDYILQNTSADVLSFAPDTAHMVAGGCDPVSVMKRYADRIGFVHLKDIREYELKSEGYATAGMEVYANFSELGTGIVDFKGAFEVLKNANYEGPLCVELDRAPLSNAASAKSNFNYVLSNY